MTGTLGKLVNHLLALETRLCEVDVVADLTWNQENGPLVKDWMWQNESGKRSQNKAPNFTQS